MPDRSAKFRDREDRYLCAVCSDGEIQETFDSLDSFCEHWGGTHPDF